MLTVTNLSKVYKDSFDRPFPILKDLSFTLPPHRLVSIIGASGCGKTTLLQIIAGLDEAYDGHIAADFKRPGPKIGYLRQSETLLPWRTVHDNIALGCELCGDSIDSARAKAEEMLYRVKMQDYKNHYPYEISGGMTQRVLLARTLVTKPSLLLLDEPLGQLDVLGRKALAAIIREYIDENNASALLVTHSVEEAVFISDYIFTLTHKPANIAVRFNLTGETDMNFQNIDRSHAFESVLNSLLMTLSR